MKTASCILGIVLVSFSVRAQPVDAVASLTDLLKAQTPKTWQVRVRWHDDHLLASIIPWPYQQAFELWYDTDRLLQTLRELCPAQSERVWTMIASHQDIVLEPSIGGKRGVEARMTCPKQQ